MKNEHDEFERLLGPFLDGELDDTTSGRVEEHLVECESCRNHLAELNALHSMVREKDAPPKLADDYWDWHRHQVWRRIRTERHGRFERSRKQRFFWLRMASVAAGAAAVLIAVVGGWRLLVSETPRQSLPLMMSEETSAEMPGPSSTGGGTGTAGKRVVEGQSRGLASAPGRPDVPDKLEDGEKSERVGLGKKGTIGEFASRAKAGEVPDVREEGWAEAELKRLPVARMEADEDGARSGLEREASGAGGDVASATIAPVPSAPPTLETCDAPPELLDIQRLPTVPPDETATVYLRALVETDGMVSEVAVDRSSGVALLDSIALMNVRQARFRSGQNEGKAVRCWVSLSQSFEASDEPAAETDSTGEPGQE